MEANAEISRQAQTISKLEQDLNRLDKSSDMTSKRLEAENNSLHLHLSKLEQQLLDAKLSYHDLQSNLKHTSNELVSSKQSQGTSSCVCTYYIFKSCSTFEELLLSISCSKFLLILVELYFFKVAKTSNPIIYKHKKPLSHYSALRSSKNRGWGQTFSTEIRGCQRSVEVRNWGWQVEDSAKRYSCMHAFNNRYQIRKNFWP